MSLLPIVSQVAEAAGGLLALGEKLGIDRSAPYHWRRIPSHHVRKISVITGIPLHELRPDLYEKPKRKSYGKALNA
jgi:hypothetical protein